MTNQEMFDIAYAAIIKQDHKSEKKGLVGKYVCAYRGDYHRKCAIGHLIKDEFYNLSLEGRVAVSCVVQDALEQSVGKGYNLNFVTSLQQCHDYAILDNFIGNFKLRMAKLAREYELTIKE